MSSSIANAVASAQSGTSPSRLNASPAPLAASPSFTPQLPTSADPSVARTVWGTPKVASVSVTPVVPSTPRQVAVDDDEPGESGGMWAQNWEEILKTDRADVSKGTVSRKKKGKKLVLMSNSVQRGT